MDDAADWPFASNSVAEMVPNRNSEVSNIHLGICNSLLAVYMADTLMDSR